MSGRQPWHKLLAEADQLLSDKQSMKESLPNSWSRYSKSPFGWILTAILLGAIGSGLWDWVLSDTLTFLGRSILQAIAYMFSGYVDILHKNVSSAGCDSFTKLPWMMFILATIVAPWMLFERLRSRLADNLERIQRLRKTRLGDDDDENYAHEDPFQALDALESEVFSSKRWLLRTLVPLTILITLLLAHQAIETIYTRSAASFIERSIDIVAPHVNAAEVLELRAQYRMVDDAATFSLIYDRLLRMGTEAGVELPEFSPIL